MWNILAEVIKMVKEFVWDFWLVRFKCDKPKIYGVNVATMTLAERRTQSTILVVVHINIDYCNHLGIIGTVCCITTRHNIKCQKVKR